MLSGAAEVKTNHRITERNREKCGEDDGIYDTVQS